MVQQFRDARCSFRWKLAGAVALVALADVLFYGHEPGVTLGLFALAWTIMLALTRPEVRGGRGSRIALLGAAGFGLALVDDPGPLDWCLFWTAIASASLLPRHRFDNAIGWAGKLVLHGLVGLGAPAGDLSRLSRLSVRARRQGSLLALIALPVVGGTVFTALFAGANPLIGRAIAALAPRDAVSVVLHLAFWMLVLLTIWSSLRPRDTLITAAALRVEAGEREAMFPVPPLATLILSLVTFNAIFTVQNASDIVFLWSGARLPEEVTLADYAHRGAYMLIATALLAGAIVLVVARPGSAGAQSPLVRRLITLWIAQNLLLVASSIARTLDYVAAYQLTVWRIAALAWMGLVAVGLVLILWRMLADRSTRWLINTNAMAAALVLTGITSADLGAIAANWNVRKARTADELDLCYLNRLDASALLPVIDLERRAAGPILRERAAWLRTSAMVQLERQQADWHSWTWRDARRLAAARERLGPNPLKPLPAPYGRSCDGTPNPPPADEAEAQPAPATPPLTRAPQP